MKDAVITATRDEIEAVNEFDNGVFGYVPRSVNVDDEEPDNARLRVVENETLSDTHYLVTVIDGRDDDWHDHEFIADVEYYDGEVERNAWIPFEVVDEELVEEVESALDDVVADLRNAGLDDASISAVLTKRANEVAPNDAEPFWTS